jgi:hypothetical protein
MEPPVIEAARLEAVTVERPATVEASSGGVIRGAAFGVRRRENGCAARKHECDPGERER